jgi:hypothetical protein
LKHSALFARAVSSDSLFQLTIYIVSTKNEFLYWLVFETGPYLTQDIDKLERIQRNGTRFITGDYKSRHEGAVTNILKDLDLPTLQDRRTNAKLVFLYQVVEGLVL